MKQSGLLISWIGNVTLPNIEIQHSWKRETFIIKLENITFSIVV